MKKIKDYISGSIDEVRNKVFWPPFLKLQSNALLVLVASFIFALLIGVMDLGFKNILEFFYTEF